MSVREVFFNNQGLDLSNPAEREYLFPMRFCLWRIARINDTAKTTVFVNKEMLTLAILSGLGAGWTTSNHFPATAAHTFELGKIKAHF